MSYEAWGDGDEGPDWRDNAIEHGWWNPDDISPAIKDMWLECERQVAEEGWTPQHDDHHCNGELTAAATCYAFNTYSHPNAGQPPAAWPWAPEWWKPKDYRRNLVIASSLIIKEIERLDRAEEAGAK